MEEFQLLDKSLHFNVPLLALGDLLEVQFDHVHW